MGAGRRRCGSAGRTRDRCTHASPPVGGGVCGGLCRVSLDRVDFNRIAGAFASSAVRNGEREKGPARTLAAIMRQPVFLVAVLNAAAAYVVMSFVMTASPRAVVAAGHGVDAAAEVTRWHLIGMFAPSFITGGLSTHYGVRRILMAGLVLSAISLGIALNGSGLLRLYSAVRKMKASISPTLSAQRRAWTHCGGDAREASAPVRRGRGEHEAADRGQKEAGRTAGDRHAQQNQPIVAESRAHLARSDRRKGRRDDGGRRVATADPAVERRGYAAGKGDRDRAYPASRGSTAPFDARRKGNCTGMT